MSERVAEVEAPDEADGHANRGSQQNLCWCHVFVPQCPPGLGEAMSSPPQPTHVLRTRVFSCAILRKEHFCDVSGLATKKQKAPESQCFQGSGVGWRNFRKENLSLDGLLGEDSRKCGKDSHRQAKNSPYVLFRLILLIRFERQVEADSKSVNSVIPRAASSLW